MSAVLAVENLVRTFTTPAGPVPVLRGANLAVAAGEVCVITGPSGSGKTTLLNLAGLLDVPTSGTIRLNQEAVVVADEVVASRHRRHTLSMVFQAPCILPRRTVMENVLFRMRYHGKADPEAAARAEALLARFGMAGLAQREARLLSGGEQQRLAVARALVSRPSLLLADEPTGNLDPASGREVMDALAGAARDGVAVLVVTHNRDWLAHADRHLVCEGGVVREAEA